jgi:hypothetical protein
MQFSAAIGPEKIRRRSPKKYRSPSRKEGISPAEVSERPGRIESFEGSRAGNGPPTEYRSESGHNPGGN